MPPTYNEEQQQLKENFKKAVEEERLGDSEDEDLLKVREKSQEEKWAMNECTSRVFIYREQGGGFLSYSVTSPHKPSNIFDNHTHCFI